MKLSSRIYGTMCFLFLSIYVLLGAMVATASDSTGSTLNFRWWAAASGPGRQLAVKAAIEGIEGTWYKAYWDGRGDVATVLHNEFEAGKLTEQYFIVLSNKAATDNAAHSPPHFSKPTASYVKAISDTYATYKAGRDLSIVYLLGICLSDQPIEPCEKTSKHQHHF